MDSSLPCICNALSSVEQLLSEVFHRDDGSTQESKSTGSGYYTLKVNVHLPVQLKAG
jgi:hypothetical protein